MKYLAIGTPSDTRKKIFTGESVMFDGILSAAADSCYYADVIDVSPKKSNSTINRLFDYIYILLKIFFKLCTQKYSFCYLSSSQSKRGFYRDYMIVSLCHLFSMPVITHQYGANYHQLLSSLSPKGMKRLISMTDYISQIIVEGDYMKQQFSFYSEYESKVLSIPNGLPIEGNNIMKPKTYNPSSPYKLLYLSNLIYSKGYFDVLKAIDLLVNQDKLDVKCVFAGRFMDAVDDVQREIWNLDGFENYVKQHHLQDYISYCIGLYGEEKDKAFCEANSFILPSYYINEGQPVSVIEAMAYGCVPIVTKFRHIPMMINDNNGLFVEPKSPESIRKVVKMLMCNPDYYKKLSYNAIEDYKKNFRFEIYANKVLSVFEKVASNNN